MRGKPKRLETKKLEVFQICRHFLLRKFLGRKPQTTLTKKFKGLLNLPPFSMSQIFQKYIKFFFRRALLGSSVAKPTFRAACPLRTWRERATLSSRLATSSRSSPSCSSSCRTPPAGRPTSTSAPSSRPISAATWCHSRSRRLLAEAEVAAHRQTKWNWSREEIDLMSWFEKKVFRICGRNSYKKSAPVAQIKDHFIYSCANESCKKHLQQKNPSNLSTFKKISLVRTWQDMKKVAKKTTAVINYLERSMLSNTETYENKKMTHNS